MLLDKLAAIARKDYTDRRQAEGIARAKTMGLYKGRRENSDRNAAIVEMLRKGRFRWLQGAARASQPTKGTDSHHKSAEESDLLFLAFSTSTSRRSALAKKYSY